MDDHHPPHVHAVIAEYDALIEIETTANLGKIRKAIKTNSGKIFDVAFDLDPLLLYENSESDVDRNERYKIGELIRSERKSAGITQKELASKCGRTRNYISRLENNKSDIELRTLRKIVEIGLYPTRLILADFCVGKWPISSLPSLAVAVAIPTFVSSI